MKAMILNTRGGPESLTRADLPKPAPKAGEVLVQVHATALTPTEFLWQPTFTSRSGAPRPFPIVLSHEFSGVIAETGTDVGDLEVGDKVFGLNDWFTNGAQAEYCVVAAATLAAKPHSINHAHAATVPISALTAWQALMVRSRLRHGQVVLIHGAAGAVGLFAVQIARDCGARVVATASAAQHELLWSLGAHETVDYRTRRFEDVVSEADVILDTQGGETLERSWAVLAQDGHLVTIASPGPDAPQRTREAFMLVEADRAQLGAIAAAIDTGRWRTFVAAEFPLEQAPEAYARARQGGPGKTVLRVI